MANSGRRRAQTPGYARLSTVGIRAVERFFRDNGLSLALLAMFIASLGGMALTGHAAHNQQLAAHAQSTVSLGSYLLGGAFLSALFENWESEFLQMAVFVVLTAILFQRGSAESRDPDAPERENDAVAWRVRYPSLGWLYEHSLGLALAFLFVASFALHCWFSLINANREASLHGREAQSILSYLGDSQLWFESFQNWQSEFLSTAVLVLLSIFLRHRGSPESKPVGAAHRDTGD